MTTLASWADKVKRPGLLVSSAGFLAVAVSHVATACPACTGVADAGSGDGITTAILFLFGVTGGVLGGVGGFALRLRRRGKRAHTEGGNR